MKKRGNRHKIGLMVRGRTARLNAGVGKGEGQGEENWAILLPSKRGSGREGPGREEMLRD